MNHVYSLDISILASARRSSDEVALFEYLDIAAPNGWQINSVEETQLPNDHDSLTVLHTASYGAPGDYMKFPFETFEANTRGLHHLFQQSNAANVAQLVYFSSAEVYGQPHESSIPTAENYIGGLPTTQQRSIYGESKRMAEVLGTVLASQTNVGFTIVRPWNLYGPGQRVTDGRVPVEFVRQLIQEQKIQLLSDGSPKRSFCYVWDGILQIASLLDGRKSIDAWNIGNGQAEISILETARSCARQLNMPEDSVSYDASAKAPGMQRCCPDATKILQEIGSDNFEFTAIEQGVAAIIDWLTFLGVES